MTWISASLLMFASSVALYLAVRRSSLHASPSQFNNLAMFAIPFVVYLICGIAGGLNFGLTAGQLLLVVFASVVFSYLGNRFSLLSIEYAPNAGYSLVISKSYVVLTTILAVLFFAAELSPQKVLAIVLIVGFSALIMIGGKVKQGKPAWLPLAFGAFFCWGFLSLASKHLFSQGVPTFVFLSYMYAIVTGCILAEIMRKRIPFQPLKKHPYVYLLIGICSAVFNLAMFEAIRLAPNVGYVNAINAGSIAAVTIFSVLLFKDDFSLKKFTGVIGVTGGLLLLLLS